MENVGFARLLVANSGERPERTNDVDQFAGR
jgi:hypothetical protein